MHDIQVSPRDLEPQQTGGRKRAERPIGVDDRKGAEDFAMALRSVEFIPARFSRKQPRHGRDNRAAGAPKERFSDRRARGNQTAPLLFGLVQQLLQWVMSYRLLLGSKNVSAGTCRSADQKLTKI